MNASRDTSGSKDPRAEELGRRIATRRRELGLSRRDVVAASGLSYPYVSQLETGYRLPSHKSLGRLAHALQLDPAELSAAIAYDEMAMTMPPRAAQVAAPMLTDAMWTANPDYEAPSKPPRASRVRTRDVVDQVTALIGELPVDRRLDALNRAQQRVVEGVVAERLEHGRTGTS
jgi:transcriptional regulator with XRE-family HTH domain